MGGLAARQEHQAAGSDQFADFAQFGQVSHGGRGGEFDFDQFTLSVAFEHETAFQAVAGAGLPGIGLLAAGMAGGEALFDDPAFPAFTDPGLGGDRGFGGKPRQGV